MDYQIKQEPVDFVRNDMLENCCLCPEGSEILALLASHFKSIHSEVFQGSFTHFCNCFEGLKLQSNLINHLLSHILGKDERLYGNSAVEFNSHFSNSTVFASNLEANVHINQYSNDNFPPNLNQSYQVVVKNEPELNQDDSAPSHYNYDSNEASGNEEQVQPKRRRKRTKRGEVANNFSYDAATEKYSCNICGRTYAAKYNVRKHLHQKHNHVNSSIQLPPTPALSSDEPKRFPCNDCPKVFMSNQGLQKHHSNEHNPKNLLKCSKCPASLATTKLFHAHARTHEPKLEEISGEASTQCPKCSKMCDTAKQLYHHMLVHREKLLVCDKCGSRFNFKTKLIQHLYRHIGFKYDKNQASKEKIVCDQCSEMVAKYNMRRHIQTKHQKIRPYKCDFPGCTSAFTESRHLNEHMNIHLGQKPFICEFCSMGFHHLSALRSHRLRHTDPERYKCEVCNDFFVTKESLRKHNMRQHSSDTGKDVRPHACDHPGCTSAFRFPDHLQRHKKTVHEEKIVNMSCHLCNFTANKAKNFFQHMRRSHGVKKRLHNRVFPSGESY